MAFHDKQMVLCVMQEGMQQLKLRMHHRDLHQWVSAVPIADKTGSAVAVDTARRTVRTVRLCTGGSGRCRRCGRLLIPLFLYQKRVLASPMFYLSEYLEAHRETYYAGLRAISADGNWTGWVAFFLEAIRQQAETNTARVRSIMDLYESMKKQVADLTRSQHAVRVLDTLFDRPVFESTDFVKRSGIPQFTALKFLRELRAAGILAVLRPQSGRRTGVYVFSELLNRAEGRKIL
jgi:hypothetical protein